MRPSYALNKPVVTRRWQMLIFASMWLVLAALVACLVVSTHSAVTHEQGYLVLSELDEIHLNFYLHNSHSQVRLAGMIINADVIDSTHALESLEGFETDLVQFSRRYRSAKRRAPVLRATNDDFEAYVSIMREYIFALEETYETMHSEMMNISTYYTLLLVEGSVLDYRDELDTRMTAFRGSLERETRKSRRTAYFITIVSLCLGSACIIFVLLRLRAACTLTMAKIEAQDRLVKLQSHEMRNEYGPAITLCSELLESEDADDFWRLKPDLRYALAALKEVETQHQARLDCYRVLRGNYLSIHETFEIFTFLRDVSTTASKNHPGVTFRTTGDGSLLIRCDRYALLTSLTHIFAAAAKRECEWVEVGFDGPRGKKLHFVVKDDGPKPQGKIFDLDVATAKAVGAGVGVPTAALLCAAAGGHICYDDRFEISVRGAVLPPPPPDLEEVKDCSSSSSDYSELGDEALLETPMVVVVVDDSAMNRRCVQRSIRAVFPNAMCEHFESFEAAQSRLSDLKDSRDVLVTMDNNLGPGLADGTAAIRWLVDQGFKGVVASSSGDAEIGSVHLSIGADLAWGKPLPSAAQIKSDVLSQLKKRKRFLKNKLSSLASTSSADTVFLDVIDYTYYQRHQRSFL